MPNMSLIMPEKTDPAKTLNGKSRSTHVILFARWNAGPHAGLFHKPHRPDGRLYAGGRKF